MRKSKPLWHVIKHVMCILWGECVLVRRKEIESEELEELCEMMSPSSSCFMRYLYKQNMDINEEDEKRLCYIFDRAFDSFFPEKIDSEALHKLMGETESILRKSNSFGEVEDADVRFFLRSMVPDTEAILAWIKNRGLEKHIIFCKYRLSFDFMETFGGAIKQFLSERLFDLHDDGYSDSVYIRRYKGKWSFIFNRKIVPVSSSIEIKNLKIIDSRTDSFSRINFERFNCVTFSRNIFCESVHIEAIRRKEASDAGYRKNELIFCENIFCRYSIDFKDIHNLIFDRNNFKGTTSLCHFPRDLNDPLYDKHDSGPPMIRLINNKVKGVLSIYNDRATTVPGSVIVKIEFLRKNRLAELSIDMGNNKLGWKMVKSDIENILFDVQEEIKPIYTDPNWLRQYKNFFLKLKDEAIEKKIDQQSLTMLEKNDILTGSFHHDGKTN